MSTSPELNLVSSLYRTTNAVVRELDRKLARDHDITLVQAITLIAINNFERPQPRLVADFLSQQSQTVTGVLDRLERAGHVIRVRDMDDRRAVRLELSDSGKKLVKDVGSKLQRYIKELVAGSDAKKLASLQEMLDDLERTVQAASN
jgi:DNA-binding MarR family transcriptional regulator